MPDLSSRALANEEMMRILQGNMNRSRVAHDLLSQLRSEHGADILIISEQYRSRDGPGWFSDESGTAAVWIPDTRKMNVLNHGAGNGYVWVKCEGTFYFSVYLTPNERIEDFQDKLERLEDAILDMRGELIIAGDFNAKAAEWEEIPDSRGKRVMDMAARLGLVLLNTGRTTTFRQPGYRETIIDISLASDRIAACTEKWRVLEDYTGSDHQYITFCVRDTRSAPAGMQRQSPRWNIAKLDKEKMSLEIDRGQAALRNIPEGEPMWALKSP